jgi:hypothetical protein
MLILKQLLDLLCLQQDPFPGTEKKENSVTCHLAREGTNTVNGMSGMDLALASGDPHSLRSLLSVDQKIESLLDVLWPNRLLSSSPEAAKAYQWQEHKLCLTLSRKGERSADRLYVDAMRKR